MVKKLSEKSYPQGWMKLSPSKVPAKALFIRLGKFYFFRRVVLGKSSGKIAE